MPSLRSTLTRCRFEKPNLTSEQWAENDARVEAFEAEQERAKKAARVNRSGIPDGYLNACFSDEGVAEWASNPTKGLLLQGDVGRGKTHNACAALLKALDDGMTARFTTFDDLLRECKATFQGIETEQSVISRYANTGMLCIDDMGKERVTEWSLPILFGIINRRSMNCKPTIVTTQYNGRQLIERMTVNGDSETARAIVSRFFEYRRITIKGKDWRR